MNYVIQALSWLAIVAGFVSAYLWYKASVTEVRKGDPRSKGGFLIGNSEGKPQLDVYSTVYEASLINKWAAIATAAAVVIQALSSVLSQIFQRP